jgi:hypothetical protein
MNLSCVGSHAFFAKLQNVSKIQLLGYRIQSHKSSNFGEKIRCVFGTVAIINTFL